MIVVIAFLLLVSLVLTTMLDELVGLIVPHSASGGGMVVGFMVNNLVALVVITLMFAAMYRFLPDARMRWRDTWVGALVTALLFVIGKLLLGVYLENSKVGASWGSAAATMVGMLVWVYYSALIILFGAEMAQAWAVEMGGGIEPEEGATLVSEDKRKSSAKNLPGEPPRK
jgi:membrane protein